MNIENLIINASDKVLEKDGMTVKKFWRAKLS